MLIYINWDGFAMAWYKLASSTAPGTPHLDRLVAQGALLENHRCGIPAITNPMQQTLVSGAWPAKTGNCYLYFDRSTRRVVETLRRNACENIVEAAQRHGLSCASVHGWYFENRGCVEGDPTRPYIQLPSHNFDVRVQELIAYLEGRPVHSAGMLRMQTLPAFLAIYADDIDSTCHNGNMPYAEMTPAQTQAQWRQNLIVCVQSMDKALGMLLTALDRLGIEATIALAADHGGAPFGEGDAAESKLAPLVQTITGCLSAGEELFVLTDRQNAASSTAQVVLLPMGTQAQLYVTQPETAARIQAALQGQAYIGACLDAMALRTRGAYEAFGDLYITAKAPYHFMPFRADHVGGSHASLEETCHHVFCCFSGNGIAKGLKLQETTYLTDFAPTVCRLLGFDGPADATGRVLEEILDAKGENA